MLHFGPDYPAGHMGQCPVGVLAARELDTTGHVFCRTRSGDDGSVDGAAEITAALQRCSQNEFSDIGSGDHPLSQAFHGSKTQSPMVLPQHSRVTLSNDSSSLSVASQASADWAQDSAEQVTAYESALQSEDSVQQQSRFLKRLQDFQKGTERLQRQVSLS